jgi:WD40 repeat protein
MLFSPDGKRLARLFLGPALDAEVWDLTTRERVPDPNAGGPPAPSPGGGRPVGSNWPWDLVGGRPAVPPAGNPGTVRNETFTPDGRRKVAVEKHGLLSASLSVWDAADGQEVVKLADFPMTEPSGLTFTPDGRRLVAVVGGQYRYTWYGGAPERELFQLSDAGQSVAFSPDGKHLMTSGFQPVRLWDTATVQAVLTLPSLPFGIGVFRPDGKRIAGAPGPGMLGQVACVWDAAAGRELLALPRTTHATARAAYSPDGRLLATGGGWWSHLPVKGPPCGEIRLCDADTGRELRTWTGHADLVTCLTFAPDGSWLATGSSDRTVKVWDVSTGQLRRTFTGHAGEVLDVAVSPDGRLLASADPGLWGLRPGEVKVWEVATGNVLQSFLEPLPPQWTQVRGQVGMGTPVAAVTFSPDGQRLAWSCEDLAVKITEVAGGRELLVLRGQAWPVAGLAFHPDGRRLAAAAVDSTVRVWDVRVAAAGQ